jgi:general secretion pathway protein A
LNNDTATMMIDENPVSLPVAELESRWFGDYSIVWRLPPNFTGAIRLGTSGPDVQWLASRLARINGTELAPGDLISYDENLIRQVKSFQLHEGLDADGIAGVQTLIRLNSGTESNVPRLSGKSIIPDKQIPDKQSAGAPDIKSQQLLARVSNLAG